MMMLEMIDDKNIMNSKRQWISRGVNNAKSKGKE